MANEQFVEDSIYQNSSDVCVVDITPPTFAGITSLTAQLDGSLLAAWGAGSDPSTPISYAIYIQASTATGLFNSANIVALTPNLNFRVYQLADGSVLQPGVTYFVGVRARDVIGNSSSNTQSLSAVSNGVMPSTSTFVYEIRGAFSINASGQLRATFSSHRNGVVGVGTLGTASYVIKDQDGNTVGITESGLTADADGCYKITPVSVSVALQDLAHYRARVTINHDGVNRIADLFIQLGE